jgi:hypothetical protein
MNYAAGVLTIGYSKATAVIPMHMYRPNVINKVHGAFRPCRWSLRVFHIIKPYSCTLLIGFLQMLEKTG